MPGPAAGVGDLQVQAKRGRNGPTQALRPRRVQRERGRPASRGRRSGRRSTRPAWPPPRRRPDSELISLIVFLEAEVDTVIRPVAGDEDVAAGGRRRSGCSPGRPPPRWRDAVAPHGPRQSPSQRAAGVADRSRAARRSRPSAARRTTGTAAGQATRLEPVSITRHLKGAENNGSSDSTRWARQPSVIHAFSGAKIPASGTSRLRDTPRSTATAGRERTALVTYIELKSNRDFPHIAVDVAAVGSGPRRRTAVAGR